VIHADAPVRICDIGGWTDTWFGGPGRVLNIAARPGVRVTVSRAESHHPVVIDLPDFGERYPIWPGGPRSVRHPVLEAAVDVYATHLPVPVEIMVSSSVPPGCATGTSAAVAVAGVGALLSAAGRSWSAQEIALAAHRLEVEVLGGESGVQDQLCAAFGGISHISVDDYPQATVEPLPAWSQLESLITVVYLGRAHHSTEVHRQVIERISFGQGEAFAQLRAATADAYDAVVARDLRAFGRAMATNTAAQAAIHPQLVGADARAVIETAADFGALGWKVNGAGGDGGSLTLLNPTTAAKSALDRRIIDLDPSYRLLDLQPCAGGLTVTGSL
jgi:D-glycero-alpha-D-manno-heptose-7-phosphate kinase